MSKLIYEVLKRTSNKLRGLYDSTEEQKYSSALTFSRLVFPTYRKKGVRVSEQELRFAFIDEFNQYCNEKNINEVFYSIETPTEDKYTFSKDGVKIDPIIGEGESGNLDLTFLDKEDFKRYLIEFKAGSVTEQAFKEVLAKSANPKEKAPYRYIIHMVKDDVSDKTIENLRAAIKWLYEESDIKEKPDRVEYVCLHLTGEKEIELYSIQDTYHRYIKENFSSKLR